MLPAANETPELFATPGYGEWAREHLHYSQALRVGNRVEISGQGGWDDDWSLPESLEEEIIRSFENVQRTLETAGATWRDVVHVNSYHVALGQAEIGSEHNDVMVAQLRRWTAGRAPIWTQTGVTALGLAGMRIEIRVTAILS